MTCGHLGPVPWAAQGQCAMDLWAGTRQQRGQLSGNLSLSCEQGTAGTLTPAQHQRPEGTVLAREWGTASWAESPGHSPRLDTVMWPQQAVQGTGTRWPNPTVGPRPCCWLTAGTWPDSDWEPRKEARAPGARVQGRPPHPAALSICPFPKAPDPGPAGLPLHTPCPVCLVSSSWSTQWSGPCGPQPSPHGGSSTSPAKGPAHHPAGASSVALPRSCRRAGRRKGAGASIEPLMASTTAGTCTSQWHLGDSTPVGWNG